MKQLALCGQLFPSLSREAGVLLVSSPSVKEREMDLGEVKMFCREIELSDDEDGLVVRVGQVPEGDTGVVVWDAAIVLAKYLQTVQATLQGRSVIGTMYLYLVHKYKIEPASIILALSSLLKSTFMFDRFTLETQ